MSYKSSSESTAQNVEQEERESTRRRSIRHTCCIAYRSPSYTSSFACLLPQESRRRFQSRSQTSAHLEHDEDIAAVYDEESSMCMCTCCMYDGCVSPGSRVSVHFSSRFPLSYSNACWLLARLLLLDPCHFPWHASWRQSEKEQHEWKTVS